MVFEKLLDGPRPQFNALFKFTEKEIALVWLLKLFVLTNLSTNYL